MVLNDARIVFRARHLVHAPADADRSPQPDNPHAVDNLFVARQALIIASGQDRDFMAAPGQCLGQRSGGTDFLDPENPRLYPSDHFGLYALIEVN